MNEYTLGKVPKQVTRPAKNLSVDQRRKLEEAIKLVLENPYDSPIKDRKLAGKIAHLKGRFLCKRRIKINDYRLIYDINDEQKEVTLLALEHRRDIYR